MYGSEEQEIIMMLRIGMETQMYLIKGSVKAIMKLIQYMDRLKNKGIINGKSFDDFNKFVKDTKGDYRIINIPTQDMREITKLCEDMGNMGITYYLMPDLNSSDGLTQIAYYAPHAPKMESLVQNFCMKNMQGGEKDFSKLQNLTGGNTSVVSIPWEKDINDLHKDLDALHINYSILPDLNVGDGQVQLVYANQDAGKLRHWFETYQKDMLNRGEPMDDMKSLNMNEYINTGTMTGNEYENTASEEVKKQMKAFEKAPEKHPFEKALDASEQKIHTTQDEKYLKLKQDPGLKEISVDKKSLIRDINDTSGMVIVRLPGTFNSRDNQEIDIALPKNEMFLTNNEETYLGFLDMEKEYRTFNYRPGQQTVFKLNPESMKGEEIYGGYFDPVRRNYKNVKPAARDMEKVASKTADMAGKTVTETAQTAGKATKSMAVKVPNR